MAHTCHWPGCGTKVPPAMWGCKSHWFRLPKDLRNRIWATYRTGQEISKTPSREYVEAALAVRDWIEANHGQRVLSVPNTRLQGDHVPQPAMPWPATLVEEDPYGGL